MIKRKELGLDVYPIADDLSDIDLAAATRSGFVRVSGAEATESLERGMCQFMALHGLTTTTARDALDGQGASA